MKGVKDVKLHRTFKRFILSVAATALVLAPIRAQDVKLTAEDTAIIRAAIEGVRPQMRLEQWGGSTTLLIFNRTIAVCPNDKSVPRERDCLKQDDDIFGEIARLATAFKNDLQEPARTEIRTSFLELNKSNVAVSPEAIAGVVVASPVEIGSKYDPNTGRGAPHASFSMPGKSSDGRAIVYVSYWCGNLCAYGWFVLVKKTPDGWRAVANELLWIS